MGLGDLHFSGSDVACVTLETVRQLVAYADIVSAVLGHGDCHLYTRLEGGVNL